MMNKETDNFTAKYPTNLNVFFLIVLAAVHITPILSRLTSKYVTLGIALLWILTTLHNVPTHFIQKNILFIKWWLIYVVYLFFCSLIGHSTLSISNYISDIDMYIIPIIMLYVINTYSIKQKKIVLYSIILLYFLNSIQNIYLGSDESIYNVEEEVLKASMGVAANAGGTVYVASCMFLIPILWIVRINTMDMIKKYIIILVISILGYYIMFVNSRTIVLIVTIVGFISYLVLTFTKAISIKKTILINFIVIAIFYVISNTVIYNILPLFSNSDRMSERLGDLAFITSGGDVQDLQHGSLAMRYSLWMLSINTFFSSIGNFLYGIGDNAHYSDYFSLLASGVGCHSEFLDLAAKFGIIGVFFIYKALKGCFNFIRKLEYDTKQTQMLIVLFEMFILYSFLNNTFNFNILFLVFVITPISIEINNNTKKVIKYV